MNSWVNFFGAMNVVNGVGGTKADSTKLTRIDMIPRCALKYDHISDLTVRANIKPGLMTKRFEEKLIEAIDYSWDTGNVKVKGNTVTLSHNEDEGEVWLWDCNAKQWQHNFAVRLDSENAFLIQANASGHSSEHEVRLMFESLGSYHHGVPRLLWQLCGAPDAVDPWRVTVDEMCVHFAIKGLTLEDVRVHFRGYPTCAAEEIVMPDGTVVGYQAGRTFPGRFPHPKLQDGKRQELRRSRYRWACDRELCVRNQVPEDGELPAFGIHYVLPQATNLRDLLCASNPLAGVDLMHTPDGGHQALACWNPQLAWSKVFTELSGLVGG